MKNIFFALMLGLTIMSVTLKAQYLQNPNALAVRMTWVNYQFPISDLKLKGEDYTYGIELSYIRHLRGNLSLAFPLKFAKADLPLDKTGLVEFDQLTVSLDALMHYKFMNPEKFIYPYFLGGTGVTAETENNWKLNMEVPLGFGVNFRIIPHLYFSIETQFRFSLSENRHQLQHAAGVWLNLGTYSGDRRVKDSDGDGIPDAKDRCPNQPGPALSFGCPDTDGDGVPDYEDGCPLKAGPPTNKGCPESDSDGDGIPDANDKCPNSPGPAWNQGCPEVKPEDKIVLEEAKKAVQFETASAKLLPASFKILDEIVSILRKYPDHKLRIEGHTDSIGSYEDNQTLSVRRARTCYDYFIGKGISSKRISFVGYGERRPIADNRFEPGREKNRRVEFQLYVE